MDWQVWEQIVTHLTPFAVLQVRKAPEGEEKPVKLWQQILIYVVAPLVPVILGGILSSQISLAVYSVRLEQLEKRTGELEQRIYQHVSGHGR